MQSAKDSFYMAMRDRLVGLNPQRTVVIDGQERPAVLVCENEAVGADSRVWEAFCLRFGEIDELAPAAAAPMSMTCTITYRTKESAEAGVLGRGRALAEMDKELRAMLAITSAPKLDHTADPPIELGTRLFWPAPKWGEATLDGEDITRVITVKIYFHPEAQR